jgi:apolipoprotein N-acyltransferase
MVVECPKALLCKPFHKGVSKSLHESTHNATARHYLFSTAERVPLACPAHSSALYFSDLHSDGLYARSPLAYSQHVLLLKTTSLAYWALPALSGILLALSFPGPPIRALSLLYQPLWAHLALLPLLLSLYKADAPRAFQRGWVTGFTFNLLCLYWVAYTQGGGAAVVGGAVLMAIYLGLFVALWALATSHLLTRWGRPALAAAPLLWVAQEYALSLGELAFPWLLLGHGQAGQTYFVQFAAWTGVYGVSFWVVLVNALLFLCIETREKDRRIPIALVALCFILPWLHARAVINDVSENEHLRIALIQPNLSISEKWGANGLEHSFTRLENLSRQIADQDPQLIVWPETALPCYLNLNPACSQRARQLVEELGIPLLTGASDFDLQNRQPYNSAFYLRPGQTAMSTYAKMHLVPFGERTPYRDSIPFLRNIDWTQLTGGLGPAEFAPGQQRTLFDYPRAPFSVLICFESVFPDLVRRHVKAGARLLINITNDSWFGASAGPYQHALLNTMRAIENRVSIARCATSGQSLFIDPFGRRYQTSELFTQAALVGEVSIAQGLTFYSRYGDLFAQVCFFSAIFCFIILRLKKTRTHDRKEPFSRYPTEH